MPDRVTLTGAELAIAAHVGALREIASLQAGRDASGGRGEGRVYADGFRNHVLGAMGELAVSKLLGVYWPATVNTFQRVPDVAGCEVRATSHPEGNLIVHQGDAGRLILARGYGPVWDVVGWADLEQPERFPIRTREGHNGRPAFRAILAYDLAPISTLEAA